MPALLMDLRYRTAVQHKAVAFISTSQDRLLRIALFPGILLLNISEVASIALTAAVLLSSIARLKTTQLPALVMVAAV